MSHISTYLKSLTLQNSSSELSFYSTCLNSNSYTFQMHSSAYSNVHSSLTTSSSHYYGNSYDTYPCSSTSYPCEHICLSHEVLLFLSNSSSRLSLTSTTMHSQMPLKICRLHFNSFRYCLLANFIPFIVETIAKHLFLLRAQPSTFCKLVGHPSAQLWLFLVSCLVHFRSNPIQLNLTPYCFLRTKKKLRALLVEVQLWAHFYSVRANFESAIHCFSGFGAEIHAVSPKLC